jgi:hypothetical protein
MISLKKNFGFIIKNFIFIFFAKHVKLNKL